jgi:H/ACA ribonucleoprotein complex subunit 3
MKVIVNDQEIRLDSKQVIGEGGEAVIYRSPQGAIKIYKQPDHPDIAGNPIAQRATARKLMEYQMKLRQFPQGLPQRVIQPLQLVTDRSGTIIGYTMSLLSSTEPLWSLSQYTFRQTFSNAQTIAILLDLHRTVQAIHNRSVVIGDFNDLNVLINGTEA